MVGYCPAAHGRTRCWSPRRPIPVNSKQSSAAATAALVTECGWMGVRPRAEKKKKIHTFQISYGRPWQVNREMSIAQLFDCFTCHRVPCVPPGGFHWNSPFLSTRQKCVVYRTDGGKSKERTDVFLFFSFFLKENALLKK